jgi:hypothetical protein
VGLCAPFVLAVWGVVGYLGTIGYLFIIYNHHPADLLHSAHQVAAPTDSWSAVTVPV